MPHLRSGSLNLYTKSLVTIHITLGWLNFNLIPNWDAATMTSLHKLVFVAPKIVVYQETFTRKWKNTDHCKMICFKLCVEFITHGIREEESIEWECSNADVVKIEEGLAWNYEDPQQINLVESLHINIFSSEIHVGDFKVVIVNVRKSITLKLSWKQRNVPTGHLLLRRHFLFLFATMNISQKKISLLWQDACLDIGAQTTVTGLQKAQAYSQFIKSKLLLQISNKKYRFEIDFQESLGCIKVRTALLTCMVIFKTIAVVNFNVPILFGLDLLNKYEMVVDKIWNMIHVRSVSC